MAWWISRQLNLLFRCKLGVSVGSEVKSAFDQSGLRWQAVSAPVGKREDTRTDGSVEALFFVGIDRAPRKARQFVLDFLNRKSVALPNLKIIWATVTVLDDTDFDLETADPANAHGFDIVVDVPRTPGSTDSVVSKGGITLKLRRQDEAGDMGFPFGHASQEKSYWSAQLSIRQNKRPFGKHVEGLCRFRSIAFADARSDSTYFAL